MRNPKVMGDLEHLHIILKGDDFFNGTSVLQIGARPGGGWLYMFEIFQHIGYTQFDILEIHEPNVKKIKHKIISNKILGDVRNIKSLIKKPYDAIVWWHGPEHLKKNEVIDLWPDLKKLANKMVIFGMPHGKWEQGEIDGNKHEKHESTWSPKDLEKLGFEVSAFGKPNKQNVMFGIYRIKR